jgi:hypothetical protein
MTDPTSAHVELDPVYNSGEGWWALAVMGSAGYVVLAVVLEVLGHRQRPIAVVASVVPFLVFAAGIAIGADWATWH